MSQSCRVFSLMLLCGAVLTGCRQQAANSAAKYEGEIPKSGAAIVSLQMELV
jgi:hypothetical protein